MGDLITTEQIIDAMRASGIFYLKHWPGTRAPRLWRRTDRGYAPVTPNWLRPRLQCIAAEAHGLAVAVLDADLSGFPPVPDARVKP
jgi:hypothetical protein